jgi:hypothetical protein
MKHLARELALAKLRAMVAGVRLAEGDSGPGKT